MTDEFVKSRYRDELRIKSGHPPGFRRVITALKFRILAFAGMMKI